MQILGSVKEWKSVFKAASILKVKHIFFLSPHTIFLMKEDDIEYVYLESTMFFSKSLIMPMGTVDLIDYYLKAAEKGTLYGEKQKFEMMNVTEESLELTGDVFYPIEIELSLYELSKSFEYKLKEAMFTNFQQSMPYFRFASHEIIKMRNVLKDVPVANFRKRKSNRTCRITWEEDKVFLRSSDESMRSEVPMDSFSFGGTVPKSGYVFNYKGFTLFDCVSRTIPIDEGFLIPFKDYSVFEGYMSNMVIKVKTRIEDVEK